MTACSDGVSHGRLDLPRLTSVRALAALTVFGFHAYSFMHTRATELFRVAYVGVGLFFVLSGFILTWVANGEIRASRFYWRRFARIYPSHLVALLLAAVLVGSRPPHRVVPTIALVQAWVPRIDVVFGLNPPSWSLSCEAFFYALFPFVLPMLRRLRDRHLVVVTVMWWCLTAVAAGVLAGHGGVAARLAYTHPILRSGEFVLGIAAALLVQRGRRLLPGSAAWSLLMVTGLACTAWPPAFPLVDVVLALPFALVIVALASQDLSDAEGVLTRRWLVFAGQISFGFYLVHEGILHALAPHTSSATGIPLALACSVVAGAGLHLAVERPMQSFLTRSPRRAGTPGTTTGTPT